MRKLPWETLFLLWMLLAGCASLKSMVPSSPSLPAAGAQPVLQGQWLVAEVGQQECSTYRLMPAQPKAYLRRKGKPLKLPCHTVAEVHIVGKDMVSLFGACPLESTTGACWVRAPLAAESHWHRLPLDRPIFFSGHKALYPCSSDNAFDQWCEWDFRKNARSRAYPPIQIPPGVTDTQNLLPLAWSPPWLLMGEEASCGGEGGKIVATIGRYWLVNLTTGLPSPWNVWQAVEERPRCLAEGDPLAGYTRLEIIGWNPGGAGELAFAIERFGGETYDRPLYAEPFQTDLYLWRMDGAFSKIGSFAQLECDLWAPDGSGWLCREMDKEGETSAYLFIGRTGRVLLHWPKRAERDIVQWLP